MHWTTLFLMQNKTVSTFPADVNETYQRATPVESDSLTRPIISTLSFLIFPRDQSGQLSAEEAKDTRTRFPRENKEII